MLLENLSYADVEDYLQNMDTVLIPVGSVEQHSPYGIIGTDFITAEEIAREVGDKMGILVAPTLNYGVSPHHMAFKGSVTLSPSTFMQIVIEVSQSFVHHGFSRIFFINGHGGNKSAVETAFQELKMRGVKGQFALCSWYDGVRESQLIEELFNNEDGNHATPSEISITMLFRPTAFPLKSGGDETVEKKPYYWPMTAAEMKDIFPDGRIDAASWTASADKGRLVFGLAVETLIEKLKHFRSIPLL